MVGRKTVDGAVHPGTRCDPDSILARVDVFPHGPCDVKAEFRRLVAGIPGLTPAEKGPEVRPGSETRFEILNTNPWALRERAPAPIGGRGIAFGRTEVWVDYWQWKSRSQGPGAMPYLEVSCLVWAYELRGAGEDFETSLAIELHLFPYLRHGTWVDPPEADHLRQAATRLRAELEALLKSRPPSPASVQVRQDLANLERLQAAMIEQHRRAAQEQRQHEAEERQRLAREKAEQIAAAERQRLEQERAQVERRREEEDRRRRQQAEEQARRDAEAVEAQQREKAARLKRTVAVLYDSSYLMGDRQKQPFLHKCYFGLQRAIVTNLVAEEVLAEVGGRLRADDSRVEAARRARGRMIELEEDAQRDGGPGYREVRLADTVTDPGQSDDPLGPDSRTDRLLIEYACWLLRSGQFRVAVVASNDGGIRRSAMKRRSVTQLPIYAIADPYDPAQTEPVEKAILAIDTQP